jgi:hypothetical protein
MPKHESFTADDGKQYQLVTEESGARIVHPVKGGGDIPFAEFPAQEWRSWTGNSETGIGETQTYTEVPASTASIPTTFIKRVNVEHLNGIATEGLASTPDRIVFQGYSKGTPYMTRDLAIGGVWFSTDGKAGESMQPTKGTWIDLQVDVSPMFRDLFLRDVMAVLHGSTVKTSTTAISFAPIPKESIFLVLSQKLFDSVKEVDGGTRLKTGRQQLSRVSLADIKGLIKAMTSGAKGDEDDW